MEAQARRAAHCGYSDSHRPGLQYGDSFDSLGDSPHSDRCGAARWRSLPVPVPFQAVSSSGRANVQDLNSPELNLAHWHFAMVANWI